MSTAVTIVLIFGWIALVCAGYPLFHGHRSVTFKRRYFRPFVLLVGCLGIALLAVHQPWSLIASIPLFGVLMSRQIRETRFCEACARPSMDARDRFCATCGDRLPAATRH
jgi:hypothetical protein